MIRYPQLYPKLKDWPIYKYASRRAEFINELRTHARLKLVAKFGDNLGEMLQKTAYLEQKRLKNNRWKVDPASEPIFWKKVESEILEARNMEPESERYVCLQILDRIIHRYSEEIVGDFKIRTYQLARKILLKFFKGLHNSISDYRYFFMDSEKTAVERSVRFSGQFERVRVMFPKGTVVFLPTHFSHLDSVMIGYFCDKKGGLPAFLYGAGLNLYDSEIFAYFMNRLGTYRVDRRKKNPIYQETLRSTSNLAIQWGVNSLFFPGGTRSRSGKIEEKLKYGLLSSLIEAQREIFEKGEDTKIIVVPVITNYHFVFEAGQLIGQELRKLGAERSVTRKGGLRSVKNILRFFGRILRKRSEVSVSFAPPIDVMGNKLSDDLGSLDEKGQRIDLKEYYYFEGELSYDEQREKVYTRQLADAVIELYHQYAEVMTSNVVAHAAFSYLKKTQIQEDIFDIIKLKKGDIVFDEKALLRIIEVYKAKLLLLRKQGRILLAPEIDLAASEILQHGLYHLGVYHMDRPLRRNKNGLIISDDLKKLYYYYNRLEFLELNHAVDWSQVLRD